MRTLGQEIEAIKQEILKQNKEKLSFPIDKTKKFPYILTTEDEERIIRHFVRIEKEKAKRGLLKRLYTSKEADEIIDQIKWEELVDVKEVLASANERANWEREERESAKEKANQLAKAKEELAKKWSASRCYNYIKWVHNLKQEELRPESRREFTYNDQNEKLIKALCYYISGDERFETELGFNFDKGLLIRGTVGLGKTYIPQLIQGNEIKPIKIISTIKISEEIKKFGQFELKMDGAKVLNLDDVGSEEATINFFGTKINWIKNFLEYNYLSNKSFFKNLIISTNCNFAQLSEYYGYRMEDRLRETMNILDVEGISFRTQKKV